MTRPKAALTLFSVRSEMYLQIEMLIYCSESKDIRKPIFPKELCMA